MFVTYDLPQRTRGGRTTLYPKVKRVYIAGDVTDVATGRVRKRSGRQVRGVRIDYERTRGGYRRQGFTAQRNGRSYRVKASQVAPTRQHFAQVVEVPAAARNVKFYAAATELPEKYRHALQAVR